MEDPWQILILDRHTATEKDVKAAYARLLKQHRPEADPEGFRRVREAYEAALDWLRHRQTRTYPEVSYAEPTPADDSGGEAGQDHPLAGLPVIFTDFPLPEEAQQALAEVEHAATTENAEQLEAALQAFHDSCEQGEVPGEARATALERAFHGKVETLATAIQDDFLVRYAELGQWNLVHLVVSAWQESGSRERLVQFSEVLLQHAKMLASPDGAMLLARVGMLTGLEQPEVAATLANAAYPHLPVDARNHVMAQLEQEAAMGRVFAEVTPKMKPFWFDRLRQGGSEFDWDSQEANRALNDVIERNRYVWSGWGVVKQLLPETRWNQVEARLRSQAQQVSRIPQKRSGFPGWLILPLVLIFINLMRFIGNDRDTGNPGLSASDLSKLEESMRPMEEKKPDKEAEGNQPGSDPAPAPASPAPLSQAPSPQGIPASAPSEGEKIEAEKRSRAIQNGTLLEGSGLPPIILR